MQVLFTDVRILKQNDIFPTLNAEATLDALIILIIL